MHSMTSKENYQNPLSEALEIQIESIVCDSDVVAAIPDYGTAIEGEW